MCLIFIGVFLFLTSPYWWAERAMDLAEFFAEKVNEVEVPVDDSDEVSPQRGD
jgi:hypothetical protein